MTSIEILGGRRNISGSPGIAKAIEICFRARPASVAWRIACATWRPRCRKASGRTSRPARRRPTRRRPDEISSNPRTRPVSTRQAYDGFGQAIDKK